MIRNLIVFLIIMAVVLVSGCAPSSAKCKPRLGLAELRSLKVDAAGKDAEAAYRSGDHRLIGVYGFSLEVPGLAGNPYDHKNEIRMLNGTGDAFCTKEEQALNHNARLYARKYNEAMLERLRSDASNSGAAQPTRARP